MASLNISDAFNKSKIGVVIVSLKISDVIATPLMNRKIGVAKSSLNFNDVLSMFFFWCLSDDKQFSDAHFYAGFWLSCGIIKNLATPKVY